jgi:DNA mismatch repair ATPase MutS
VSKLLNQFNELKKQDASSIYIFRVGIFYNILNEDAHTLNEKLGLKLTSLSPEITKCGFPISSLDKYTQKLDKMQIKYSIIDNLTDITITDYSNNIEFKKIINKIKSIDIDNTNPIDALNILNDLKNKIEKI